MVELYLGEIFKKSIRTAKSLVQDTLKRGSVYSSRNRPLRKFDAGSLQKRRKEVQVQYFPNVR